MYEFVDNELISLIRQTAVQGNDLVYVYDDFIRVETEERIKREDEKYGVDFSYPTNYEVW